MAAAWASCAASTSISTRSTGLALACALASCARSGGRRSPAVIAVGGHRRVPRTQSLTARLAPPRELRRRRKHVVAGDQHDRHAVFRGDERVQPALAGRRAVHPHAVIELGR